MPKIKKILSNDPDTKSANIVAENIESLKTLFPDAFEEGKIDFDVLRQLLGGAVDEKDEKYGLNWHGKRKARQLALTPSSGTLLPCPDESLDWDTTQNLMIEGDNLEVLKLLQKSYAGKIKLIYIDPPYNTGKDFVYPDNFRESIKNYLSLTGQIGESGQKVTSNTEASGRFHTEWLNMMYPRLKLARTLLRSDGVIAVSIDDTEVANIRLALDEIFGEENFVCNIVWQKKYGAANDAKYLSDIHDHILLYARNKDSWRPNLFERPDELNAKYSNPDNDARGPWYSTNLSVKTYSAANDYEILSPNGISFHPPPSRAWVVSRERYNELLKDNRIWFGKDGNSRPYQKTFLSEVQQGIVPTTLWLHEDAGHNIEAKSEIRKMFGEDTSLFDTPKPTRLIGRILKMSEGDSSNSLILDFFAGSGTTGHAVMKANAADGGRRQFILVQLPQATKHGVYKNLASVCAERVRRSAQELRQQKPNSNLDLGFRYFSLNQSSIRSWNPEPSDLEGTLLANAEHLVPGRTEQDVLYELLLKLGLDLCVPIEKKDIGGKAVHSIGSGALIVCLADGLTTDTVEAVANGIVAWWKELAPAVDTRVVFKDSSFVDDVAKANMAAILNQNGILDVRSL